MRKKYSLAAALGLAMLAPVALAQQVAVTTGETRLMAGPERDYPVVAVLPRGAQVIVQGCVPGWRWCDVTYGRERGWAEGASLIHDGRSGYAPLSRVGATAGVAVLGFVLHDYWRDHYRSRSWYAQRDQWARKHPPVHQGPAVRPPPNHGAAGKPHAPQHTPPPPQAQHRPPHAGAPPHHPHPGQAPAQVRPRPQQPPSNSGWDPRWPNARPPEQP